MTSVDPLLFYVGAVLTLALVLYLWSYYNRNGED
jgi:hypothetical protein